MSILDEIKRTQKPTRPPIKGKIWMTMLIEYNYETGESKILRSFSKHAEDSKIKFIKKEQQQKEEKIEISEIVEKQSLF